MLRLVGAAVLVLVGSFLVARAVAELFVLDASHPASYARDWGGPSYSGVLAVHTMPGVVVLLLAGRYAVSRRSRARTDTT